MTVASLGDLGYEVDLDAAENYELPDLLDLAEAGSLVWRTPRRSMTGPCFRWCPCCFLTLASRCDWKGQRRRPGKRRHAPPRMMELAEDALIPEGSDVIAISAPGLNASELRGVLRGLDPDIGALAAPDLDSASPREAGKVLFEVAGEQPELLSAIAALWTVRVAAMSQRRLKQVTLDLSEGEVAVAASELAEGVAAKVPEKLWR